MKPTWVINKDLYSELVRRLKKLKTAYPVSIIRRPIKMTNGHCWKKGKKFYIVIAKELTDLESELILVHEYAHILSWSHLDDVLTLDEFDEHSHNEHWGIEYAKCYRVYEELITEYNKWTSSKQKTI